MLICNDVCTVELMLELGRPGLKASVLFLTQNVPLKQTTRLQPPHDVAKTLELIMHLKFQNIIFPLA